MPPGATNALIAATIATIVAPTPAAACAKAKVVRR
jgi:hypothetical protein